MKFGILINAPFKQGQLKSGVEKGCAKLTNLVKSKFNLKDSVTFAPTYSTFTHNSNWKNDYSKLYEFLCSVNTPYVLVGGDHSIGMSSVATSIYKTSNVSNLYVIWIDAHADSNTMEASITKNIHGQPLAGILGYEEPWFAIRDNLPFQNLLYFGLRDVDEFEKVKITEHNIFFTSDTNLMSNKITQILNNNKDAVFHVSFDVDALDSSIMKSTGCVVDNGLYPIDVINIIKLIKHHMIAFDLVEFNPEIGNIEDVETSYNSIAQILDGIAD